MKPDCLRYNIRGEAPVFACGSLLHTKIYETAKRTLHLCMHEHYEDCPWREQALYGFDSRNQMLCGYYAFGEFDYARENLRLLALSQREDGLLELCAPARVPVNIPSFSLAFIIALEEYCRYSGDLAFGEEMLETADKILDSLRGHIHNGTAFCYQEPGYWNFYEWNELLDGQPMEHESLLLPSADAGLRCLAFLHCSGWQPCMDIWAGTRGAYSGMPGACGRPGGLLG